MKLSTPSCGHLAWIALPLVLASMPVHALSWDRTYGTSGIDLAYDVTPTSDGGFVVAGSTERLAPFRDGWVAKLFPDGSLQWQRTFGGSGLDEASAVIEASDGGYVVVGWSSPPGTDHLDAWVLRLTEDGALIKELRIGGAGTDSALDVVLAHDGAGYVVAGNRQSGLASDGWLIGLSEDLEFVWQVSFGGPGFETFHSIDRHPSGYVAAGATESFGAELFDAWVVSVDRDGQPLAQRRLSMSDGVQDNARAVRSAGGDGFLVVGETEPAQGTRAAVWRLEPDLSVRWSRTYDDGTSHLAARSVDRTSRGWVLAGEARQGSDLWVLDLDTEGNVLSEIAHGSPGVCDGLDGALSVRSFSTDSGPGGFAVAGFSTSFGAGSRDVWLMRLPEALVREPACPTGASTSIDVTSVERPGVITDAPPFASEEPVSVVDASPAEGALVGCGTAACAAPPCSCEACCTSLPDEVSASGAAHPVTVSRMTPADDPIVSWEPGTRNGSQSFEWLVGDVRQLVDGCSEVALAFGDGATAPWPRSPTSGVTRFVLVRGVNETGRGPAGFDSSGRPRELAEGCPDAR